MGNGRPGYVGGSGFEQLFLYGIILHGKGAHGANLTEPLEYKKLFFFYHEHQLKPKETIGVNMRA